jgi:L-fuculose-phosphate aldolase
MNSFDLTHYKVVAAEDIEAAAKAGATELIVRAGAILTPSARDSISERGFSMKTAAGPKVSGAPASSGSDWDRLFNSPEAQAIKQEIIQVGRKLWQRAYVDGNGGNISYRLTADAVICTPTLTSKADLKPEDLCLVDLEGNQLAGGKPRTSEILLHLEIYKAVPEAKAAVHCHPPHATAYAITGRVPPTCVIPEYEVFIGKVALSPYETPGTQKFAETVLPYVKTHNTVLLANHGIICWADTVTHAEWFVEVVDTYCWTLMLAGQLGSLTHIPEDKASDLLAIKQKLGLPDARFDAAGPGMKECQLCDLPDLPGSISLTPKPCVNSMEGRPPEAEIEAMIQSITDAVLATLNNKLSQ